ncbi:hypothetical protein AB0C65_08160 [Nocardia sp. NPDC048505]|uniref:hypothetical protein n=1 Tax=Nocardia sp. NPDC048505 TaxID=3155756 RepID=UPI003401D17B
MATHTVDSGAGRPARLRWLLVIVLLVLLAVLSVASVLARFAHSEVLDTDRYVATVAPLGSDPVLRDGLTDRITVAIADRLDLETVSREAVQAIVEAAPRVPRAVVGLSPVFAAQAEDFVRDTTASVLASPEFETLWTQVNRRAHSGVVAVLAGDAPAALGMDAQGTVTVSLAPIIDRVRVALLARGFTLAERLPSIDEQFTLFRSPELVEARRWVSALDRAALLLPLAALLVGAGAVWAAPEGARRRAFSWVGATAAVAMALLAVALGIARSAYVRTTPADLLSARSAGIVLDAFLAPLRTTLWAVFVLGVVIALAGYLTGSSRSAEAIRTAADRMAARVRRTGSPS